MTKYSDLGINTAIKRALARKKIFYYNGTERPNITMIGEDLLTAIADNDTDKLGMAGDEILPYLIKDRAPNRHVPEALHAINEELGYTHQLWIEPTYEELAEYNEYVGNAPEDHIDSFRRDETNGQSAILYERNAQKKAERQKKDEADFNI